MTLPDGLYTLKATPFIPVYATNNGLKEIVTILEQNPSTVERQIWNIYAVEGKQDVYHVYVDTFVGREGWALKDDSSVPHGPIITTREHIGEWHIDSLHNGRPFSYTIRPVTKAVGAAYYVATNNESQVVVKALPITDRDVPYWQIQPPLIHQ
ncbi:hypothetical protein K443DRAFT_92300 [Laccaria amethystina LaAM-08-1]|uniref:Ricin B lectin domain-containing protein n=1 Tax=Laccaria amethystina LaAM-08-1 TaxID=1095629 RepID=A0A0C9WYD4_9AGAR|nr:hypothetical protein K443DRAFT_92300 [Laccaria amethystina LaAM-08-1]